jgi:RNase P subunit RPR2
MIDPQQQELTQVQRLTCLECERVWTDPGERWRIYVTTDEQPEAVLYCADCAAFEFDP